MAPIRAVAGILAGGLASWLAFNVVLVAWHVPAVGELLWVGRLRLRVEVPDIARHIAEMYRRWGLKSRSNDEMREDFVARVTELVEKDFGLQLPKIH